MVKGQVDNSFVFDGILKIFKNELSNNISLMIKILIVVIILQKILEMIQQVKLYIFYNM